MAAPGITNPPSGLDAVTPIRRARFAFAAYACPAARRGAFLPRTRRKPNPRYGRPAMRPTAIPKLPDFRKVQLLLIRTLDMLPANGPEWHPTYQTARRVREH